MIKLTGKGYIQTPQSHLLSKYHSIDKTAQNNSTGSMYFTCSTPLSNGNCWYKHKLINIIISMKFWGWYIINIKEKREAAAFAYFIGNDNHPFVIYRHLADEKHTVSRYSLQQWSFLVCNLTTSLPPHRLSNVNAPWNKIKFKEGAW